MWMHLWKTSIGTTARVFLLKNQGASRSVIPALHHKYGMLINNVARPKRCPNNLDPNLFHIDLFFEAAKERAGITGPEAFHVLKTGVP